MKRNLIILLGGLFVANCGTQNRVEDSDVIIREATDAPMSFEGIFENMAEHTTCQTRLVDPVDDTELVLISTLDGIGNYQVPLGKYGLSSDELLRIDCRSGEVIGVVKKR